MTEKTFRLSLDDRLAAALVASMDTLSTAEHVCFTAHGVSDEEGHGLAARAKELASHGAFEWDLTAREAQVLHCAVASGDTYGPAQAIQDYGDLEGQVYNLKLSTGFNGNYLGGPITLI